MPSERFYRLPEDKRNKIRDACLNEYIRSGFDRASVGRLIKEAQISRGSFYTYFESRQDVMSYLHDEYAGEFYDCGRQCVEESNGDIWAMLEQFLERAIRLCERKQNREFLRNQLDSGERNTLLLQLCGMAPDICGNSRRRTLQQQIYERCVGVSMRAMSWERFTAFFDLAMTCIGMEIARFFDGIPLDEVREHFRAREEVLRCGVNLLRRPAAAGRRDWR